jgi:hypothetical protein
MGPLTLLPLLGIAFGVSRAARVSPAAAFFLGVAFVVLALYVGALAGALWWTALAVHIGGFTLLLGAALQQIRRRAPPPIPLPIGVLVLLCTWFWAVHGGDQFFLYDEYAHWGVFLKEILALDGLWTGDTNSMHPRYPPGAPLFQYLFNAFVTPSDGKAYFAHFVLLFAPLLMLWNSVRWSQPIWLVAIFALVLLAIANFGLGVATLYVDQIIGVWFLGAILAAAADDNLASPRVTLYAAPLAVLAVLKDAGFPLAVSGAAIVAALFCYRALGTEHSSPSSSLRRTGVALAVLLAPLLLCVQMWSWNRDAAGAEREIQSVTSVVANGIAGGIRTADASRDIELARRLADVFFDQQLSNSQATWRFNEFSYAIRELFTDSYRLTTFGLLVGFVLWWLAIAYGVLADESRRRWLIVAGGVFCTAVAYIAFLHVSYRFSFGERGIDLPSYVRYVHVVALPMLLVSFCPLLPAFQNGPDSAWVIRGRVVSRRGAICVAAVLALYAVETPYLRPILSPNPKTELRTNLETMIEEIRADVGTSRTWIYYTADSENGFIARMALYLFAPTPAVVETSETFLQNANAASVAETLSAFEYLWIASPLTPEASAGLARFSAGNVTAPLYRVRPAVSGTVLLEPIGQRVEAH